MTDLHARLLAAVTARRQLAEAATPGPWTQHESTDGQNVVVSAAGTMNVEVVSHDGDYRIDLTRQRNDAENIAANDPATVIRQCDADLELIEPHKLASDGACEICRDAFGIFILRYPCAVIRNRAKAYDVPIEDQA